MSANTIPAVSQSPIMTTRPTFPLDIPVPISDISPFELTPSLVLQFTAPPVGAISAASIVNIFQMQIGNAFNKLKLPFNPEFHGPVAGPNGSQILAAWMTQSADPAEFNARTAGTAQINLLEGGLFAIWFGDFALGQAVNTILSRVTSEPNVTAFADYKPPDLISTVATKHVDVGQVWGLSFDADLILDEHFKIIPLPLPDGNVPLILIAPPTRVGDNWSSPYVPDIVRKQFTFGVAGAITQMLPIEIPLHQLTPPRKLLMSYNGVRVVNERSPSPMIPQGIPIQLGPTVPVKGVLIQGDFGLQLINPQAFIVGPDSAPLRGNDTTISMLYSANAVDLNLNGAMFAWAGDGVIETPSASATRITFSIPSNATEGQVFPKVITLKITEAVTGLTAPQASLTVWLQKRGPLIGGSHGGAHLPIKLGL